MFLSSVITMKSPVLSVPEPTENLLVLFGERAKASPALTAPLLDSIIMGPTKAGI
jgi:hypothetical protein